MEEILGELGLLERLLHTEGSADQACLEDCADSTCSEGNLEASLISLNQRAVPSGVASFRL